METASNIGNILLTLALIFPGLPIAGLISFIGYNNYNHGSFEMYDPDKHDSNDPNTRTGWILMGVGGFIFVVLLIVIIARVIF